MVLIENLSLMEPYTMIDQHKLHMNFLNDTEILTDEKKEMIVDKISYVFEIIEGRLEKKRNHSPDDNISCSSQK